MPKYNKMLEGFDLLDFAGVRDTETRQETEAGTSNSTNVNDNRFSNLPQNEIDDVQDGSYMTDYTLNQGTNEASANRNTNETIVRDKLDTLDEYKKFMEQANNIYEEIFKECNCLFFGLI